MNLFKKKTKKGNIPKIEDMQCRLNRTFHKCEIHRCSTYGCLKCGQYQKKN